MNKGLVRNRVVLLALAAGSFACASVRQADYATPEEAMQVLADVVETGDHERADQLFGADGRELLRSGDEVADREDAVRVKAAIREKLTFADHGDGAKLALIGNDEWPFPIPLVQDGARWRFDVEAGVEELENRRIGRNELSTIATMHEYVDAQREYHALPRDGQPPAYAQKLLSSPGQHDGLFWPVEPGQPESPMGPFVAEAQAEGYSKQADEPAPYHGYFYRVVTAQGASAPGGARSYLDGQGRMTRGFALLAWPAKYGSSGVMTFLVNHQGIVYQKDLGPETAEAVTGISAFAPDETWQPTNG